jgi:hypothetical protein
MAQHLSQHLWSVAILVGSASLALVAERIAIPGKTATQGGLDVGGLAGIEQYVSRVPSDSVPLTSYASISLDPFDSHAAFIPRLSVASRRPTPTVPSSRADRLSAILVADNRRIAVIDDATVTVGDVLGDGTRVSSIQPDRVWLVERTGRWRMLTLGNRGTR